VTRRDLLRATVTAAALGQVRLALAQPSLTPVSFDVPAGACDCHTHIHGDPEKFPFSARRVYTPPPALPDELAALHKALRLQRVVIVTPSVYGTDNSATLYGMRARGRDARGVAVVDDNARDDELDRLSRAGVRGMRLNLATAGINDPDVGRAMFRIAAERARRRRWHVQMNTSLLMIDALKDALATSPVPVVLDHFGGARSELGTGQAGFSALVGLVQSGRAYVKISAPYRVSTVAPDYPDVAALANALVAANPERILWGSDWPHPDSVTPPGRKPTDVTPFLPIDDGRVFNLLASWVPSPSVRRQILVENPARLYGF
jgi:predicted TIM-barrel fold metal-dependent hydrolase